MQNRTTLEHLQHAMLELLPAMVADGGGAELVSLEGGVAKLRLSGTCLYCPSRKMSAEALCRQLLLHVSALQDVQVEYPPIAPQVSNRKLVNLSLA